MLEGDPPISPSRTSSGCRPSPPRPASCGPRRGRHRPRRPRRRSAARRVRGRRPASARAPCARRRGGGRGGARRRAGRLGYRSDRPAARAPARHGRRRRRGRPRAGPPGPDHRRGLRPRPLARGSVPVTVSDAEVPGPTAIDLALPVDEVLDDVARRLGPGRHSRTAPVRSTPWCTRDGRRARWSRCPSPVTRGRCSRSSTGAGPWPSW